MQTGFDCQVDEQRQRLACGKGHHVVPQAHLGRSERTDMQCRSLVNHQKTPCDDAVDTLYDYTVGQVKVKPDLAKISGQSHLEMRSPQIGGDQVDQSELGRNRSESQPFHPESEERRLSDNPNAVTLGNLWHKC